MVADAPPLAMPVSEGTVKEEAPEVVQLGPVARRFRLTPQQSAEFWAKAGPGNSKPIASPLPARREIAA